MPIDKNDIPLTLSQLSEQLNLLGITGVSVSTLRTMANDGTLEVNRDGHLRSTVNAFIKARSLESAPKADVEA